MVKWFEESGEQEDVVVSSRIRLIRNLREYPFPVKMSSGDRHALVDRVTDTVMDENSSLANSFRFLNMEKLSKAEAVSLVERHVTSPDFISECDGRGIFLSEEEASGILLNSENHILIQVHRKGLDLQAAYRQADRLDTILDKSLHFAFDSTLGFLTQNLANLGTGMQASLVLHLPALMEGGEIVRTATNLSKLGLALRGVYGTGAQSRGAMYQLSNQVSLGLTEQEALANLGSIATQVISQERSARTSLAKNIEVQDTVSRSLAILQSARVLTNDEFMGLISNVRFGVSVGLASHLDYTMIDRLIIQAQPATLVLNSGKQLTLNERHALRAQVVSHSFNNKWNKAEDDDGRPE